MTASAELGANQETLTVGNEIADNDGKIVYVLTRFLADVCDGAHLLDGVGFNSAHSVFGKKMAGVPFELWSPRQIWAMRRILETYKNTQLAGYWKYVPDIPEPPKQEATERDESYIAYKTRIDPNWRPVRTFRSLEYVADGGQYDRTSSGIPSIVFKQNYDAELIQKIKEIPGRRYTGDPHKAWIVPFTVENVGIAIRIACEEGYYIEGDVASAMEQKLSTFSAKVSLSHSASVEEAGEAIDAESHALIEKLRSSYPENLKLYPFQEVGVLFACRATNVLIGDDMGLGKTPEALMTVEVTESYPMLVVCPASLKDNWYKESRRWVPKRSVLVVHSSKDRIINYDNTPIADITIINYDILKSYASHFLDVRFGAIVADECHKLKSQKSLRHRYMSAILRLQPDARRIFLSGTSVVNQPMDLWSLIDLLGYGETFGGIKRYKMRYNTNWNVRLKELGQRIREIFFIRRTKMQVLTELPEKQRTIVPLELSNRAIYASAERDLARYMATIAVEKSSFDPTAALNELIELGLEGIEAVEFLNNAKRRYERDIFSEKHDIVSRNERLMRWGQLKKLAVEGKMDSVFEWVDEFLENSDQKLVIFVWHVDVGQRISRRYRADFIYGGMPVPERQIAVDRFWSEESRRILVGNIQAAGEGLNMQIASNVVFVEYGWNPKDHRQAEDRCHRIGQKNSVNAWYLSAGDTIEDEIAQLIDKKLQIIDSIQEGSGRDVEMQMIAEVSEMMRNRVEGRR